MAAILALAVLASTAASADAKPRRTWFVQAGAAEAGTGTRARPFATLAEVEARSAPRDKLVVLSSPGVLDGGLELKPGQSLNGEGTQAQITNTTDEHLNGDAVRLADGNVVRNLRIAGVRRGGLYGRNVDRVTITRNEVSGHNTSCTRGFQIPPFNVPTIVGGVGVPISEGLSNGWAGIQIDADAGASKVGIYANRVRDADCGDGIDVRASGTARVVARIGGNDITDLREGPDFQSILAIGLQATDRSDVTALLDDNRQAGLGNDEDTGIGPGGADTEGIFVNPADRGHIQATITRNRYTHTPGRGAFSSNGLEFVSMGDGARGEVEVRDSRFTGTPGDVLEQLALGTNGHLRMSLDRVTAAGSTGFGGSGFGDTVVIPGNNSDCLIGASGGAGNTVELSVRRTVLTGCANNGLTFGSSVANGTGPSNAVSLEVADSRITGNGAGNLRLTNLDELGSMKVKVERTDLSDSRGLGTNPSNLAAQDLGSTGSSVIDLGGGPLGSAGGNCLAGGPLAALLARYDVDVANAWWGAPGGPGPGRVVAVGGALRAPSPLAARPAGCDQPVGARRRVGTRRQPGVRR